MLSLPSLIMAFRLCSYEHVGSGARRRRTPGGKEPGVSGPLLDLSGGSGRAELPRPHLCSPSLSRQPFLLGKASKISQQTGGF